MELIADAERNDCGHIRTRRLAADEHRRTPELLFRVLKEPTGDCEPVVGTCRPRVFGGLSIVGGHHSDAELLREHAVGNVHHGRRARDHPPTVEMEVDGTNRSGRPENATRNTADLADLRLGHGKRYRVHRPPQRRDHLLVRGPVGGRFSQGECVSAGVNHGPSLWPQRLDLVGPQLDTGHVGRISPHRRKPQDDAIGTRRCPSGKVNAHPDAAVSSHRQYDVAVRKHPAGDFDYERFGQQYSTIRRPDPRIAALVRQALGNATSVINVGAVTAPMSQLTSRSLRWSHRL